MNDRCMLCGAPAEEWGPYTTGESLCRACVFRGGREEAGRRRIYTRTLVVVGCALVVEAAALAWWALS